MKIVKREMKRRVKCPRRDGALGGGGVLRALGWSVVRIDVKLSVRGEKSALARLWWSFALPQEAFVVL